MTGTIMLIFFLIFVLFVLQIITMSSYFGGITASGAGAGAAATISGLSAPSASGMVNTQIAFTVIMMLLAIAMYFYITNNPQHERTYIMFMLHSTLFVAVLSTSINVMNKIARA